MITLARIIATAGGIGFLRRGAGTVAAVAFCIAWYYFPINYGYQVLLLAVILTAGTWSASVVETIWEHDSNRIVIDEVAGMMVSIAFLPNELVYIIIGCVLFRFFDIVKPLGITRAERLPRGMGVMADDVLAGVYAQLIVRALVVSKPLFQ